jgi:hypothetical protein
MLAGGEARLPYLLAKLRPGRRHPVKAASRRSRAREQREPLPDGAGPAPWRRAGEDTGHHRSPGPRFLAKPHWTPPVPHDAFDKAGTTQHLQRDAYVYSNEFPAIRGHIRPMSTCKIARPVVQKRHEGADDPSDAVGDRPAHAERTGPVWRYAWRPRARQRPLQERDFRSLHI